MTAIAASKKEEDDLRRVVQDYVGTLRANNTKAASAYWASNAAYLGHGSPDVRGSKDLGVAIAALFSSGRVEYPKITIDDVHATADLGVVSGISEAVIRAKDQEPVTKVGRYLWVFRRESSGWKLALAMTNDLPPKS